MFCSQKILDFWFSERDAYGFPVARKAWFEKNEQFDLDVKKIMGLAYQEAKDGNLNLWESEAYSCLALVILLDQAPRNMFRGASRMYSSDVQARAVAKRAIDLGYDKRVSIQEVLFFYIPFMHSEDLKDQHYCEALFAALPSSADLEKERKSAARHREIIARFGRFPHRNKTLGRRSTPTENAFLKTPNSSF